MGSRKSKLIQHRMDAAIVGWLDELADAERRSRTAELEHLIAQEWQRKRDGVEPAVRVDRLELRVQGWRESAASLRSRPPLPDETREHLDGMADAYGKAADEVDMEIRTRG